MSCNKKITEDILFNCADMPIKGLSGGGAVLINFDDIDLTATTFAGATITDLVLKTGATGYKFEWYKELASTASAFAPNAEDVDGYTHSFLGRLIQSSADNAERAAELKAGRFIVVVETNYKGLLNADAFKVYGAKAGLELAEMTANSNENSGSLTFTLTSKEGYFEPYPYNVFLETDYATSKASFDALFASV